MHRRDSHPYDKEDESTDDLFNPYTFLPSPFQNYGKHFALLMIFISDLPTCTFSFLSFPTILLLEHTYYILFVVLYHMDIIARQEPVWRHVLDLRDWFPLRGIKQRKDGWE